MIDTYGIYCDVNEKRIIHCKSYPTVTSELQYKIYSVKLYPNTPIESERWAVELGPFKKPLASYILINGKVVQVIINEKV